MEPHDPSSTSSAGSGRRPGQFDPVPFGKYFLLDRIAVGGMAEIFRARAYGHAGFEKELVIKRILSHLTENEDFVTMFIDEAKLTVQLTHPCIVQVYDFGKSRDHFFLAMEGVYGKDLKTVSAKLDDKHQQIPMQFAAYVAHEAAKGLYYAHTKRDERGQPLNIVHRDISPSNIMLSYDGQVKLLDFGIAKAESSAIEDTEGVLKGKFEYMSPEQAAGQLVDNRSDIFSLGICLWEMVTGRRLFKSDKKLEILERIRAADIPQVRVVNPEIPRELEHIIHKALAKEPRARYQDAEQMRHELEEYLKPTGTNELTLDVSEWMQDLFVLEMEQERLRLESAREAAQSMARMEDNLDLDFEPEDEEDTIETDEEAEITGAGAPPPPPATDAGTAPKRKIPGLVWVALAALVLAVAIGAVALRAVIGGDEGGGGQAADDDATAVAPKLGSLVVEIVPGEAADGAAVTLDGEAIESPVEDLEPGRTYTLKVAKEGFQDHEESFTAAAGERIRIRATMIPEGEEPATVADAATPTPAEPSTPADLGPGTIIFRSSPAGAQVVLNGNVVGNSPYRFTSGTPGRRYTATFKLDGYEDATASGTFPGEGQITARATLTKKAKPAGKATININAKPWATVYLDGKNVGNTPMSTQVDAGAHVVRLVCPPLDAEKTIPFNVTAGETRSVTADLEE